MKKIVIFSLSSLLMISNIFANNITINETTKQTFTPKVEVVVKENEVEKTRLEDIKKRIIPKIVYATTTINTQGIPKGTKVEIIQDRKNGKQYEVKYNNKKVWIKGSNLKLIYPEKLNLTDFTNEELELYINSIDAKSDTQHYIWVVLYRQKVYVFKGKNKNWKVEKILQCSSGKDKTSTIRGYFKVGDKGKSFGQNKGYTCYNWVRIQGDYLFHSLVHDLRGNLKENTLGTPASDGCVRFSLAESKWFSDNMETGSTIWIY